MSSCFEGICCGCVFSMCVTAQGLKNFYFANSQNSQDPRNISTILYACLHIYLHSYDQGTSEVIGASTGSLRAKETVPGEETGRCGRREERTADEFAEQGAGTNFSTRGTEGKGIQEALYSLQLIMLEKWLSF